MKRWGTAAAMGLCLLAAAGCDFGQKDASAPGATPAPTTTAAGRSGPSRGAALAAQSPAGASLLAGASAPTGPLSRPGSALFDGDSRAGSSFFSGGAVPVSRPSTYSGPFSFVPRLSDLTTTPPPPFAGDPEKEGRLMRAVRAIGGDVSVASTILQAAVRKGVDPILAVAVGTQESGLHNGIRSSAGALGAMQVMPGTACEMGVCNRQAVRYDAATNANLGTTYLQRMLALQGGNVPLALASYNAGPGAVRGRIPNNGETPDYVNKVLGYYRRFRDAVSI